MLFFTHFVYAINYFYKLYWINFKNKQQKKIVKFAQAFHNFF